MDDPQQVEPNRYSLRGRASQRCPKHVPLFDVRVDAHRSVGMGQYIVRNGRPAIGVQPPVDIRMKFVGAD